MVLVVFIQEEAGICIDHITVGFVEYRHFLYISAVGTFKASPNLVPPDSRFSHIAVAGGLFGENTVNGFVVMLIVLIEFIHVRHRLYMPGKAVGDGFMQFAYPFARNM